jgi:hypothetical protein
MIKKKDEMHLKTITMMSIYVGSGYYKSGQYLNRSICSADCDEENYIVGILFQSKSMQLCTIPTFSVKMEEKTNILHPLENTPASDFPLEETRAT